MTILFHRTSTAVLLQEKNFAVGSTRFLKFTKLLSFISKTTQTRQTTPSLLQLIHIFSLQIFKHGEISSIWRIYNASIYIYIYTYMITSGRHSQWQMRVHEACERWPLPNIRYKMPTVDHVSGWSAKFMMITRKIVTRLGKKIVRWMRNVVEWLANYSCRENGEYYETTNGSTVKSELNWCTLSWCRWTFALDAIFYQSGESKTNIL